MGMLDDKRAVVMGAGSGVGRATSLRFAEEGARVVCADINEEGAKETVRLIEAAGGTAIAVRTDVAKEADVKAAIARATFELLVGFQLDDKQLAYNVTR